MSVKSDLRYHASRGFSLSWPLVFTKPFSSLDSCLWRYTAISRKVVGKNVHPTTPKGNMGYDQCTVPNDCSCRTYFCCFPLSLAIICPWPLLPFFQMSLENRTEKTTHNTFRACRVHFFRQPFSKQL